MDQLQRQQQIEALVGVALLTSKDLAVRLAEIIAYLQKQEHLAALGALQGTEEPFRLLQITLSHAARIT